MYKKKLCHKIIISNNIFYLDIIKYLKKNKNKKKKNKNKKKYSHKKKIIRYKEKLI